VVLDGAWASPSIPQNPKVNVIYVPEAIGQRSAAVMAAKLARGKYIVKVDAHCSFEQGWDKVMLDGFKIHGDNCVMVPVMRNLHAYWWKCYKCGKKVYQDVKPICPDCGNRMRKKMVWRGRRGTAAVAYCFDPTYHFQYFGEIRKREPYLTQNKTGFTETMALQGSFFMCSKEKYFDLKVDDEEFGSWGNQGWGVAAAFWLSGGKVLVNHNTSYAHMFRTKGDTFGFPYPQSGREVQKTKNRVREKFCKMKHHKQIYPVSWLVEKFRPSCWSDQDLANLKEYEKQYFRNLKKQ